jgi:cobalt-zinc-cadmium efflux system protein
MIVFNPEKRKRVLLERHSHLEKKLWVAIVLNGLIPLAEVAGGILLGSLALISDALHNLVDLFSLLLSLVGERSLRWKPNQVKTYGYGRVEILIATVNSVSLLGISLYIMYKAGVSLFSPRPLEGSWIMLIAGGSFLANFISALLLNRESKDSLNIKSAFLHLMLDAGQSLGIVIAGALITLFGWNFLDPAFSLLIGLLILFSASRVLKDSLNILNEGVPKDLNLKEIEEFIKGYPGVKGIHHLHVWSISTRNRALSAHIVVEDQLLSESGKLIKNLSTDLKEKFLVTHPTFQVECGSCPNGSCLSK